MPAHVPCPATPPLELSLNPECQHSTISDKLCRHFRYRLRRLPPLPNINNCFWPHLQRMCEIYITKSPACSRHATKRIWCMHTKAQLQASLSTKPYADYSRRHQATISNRHLDRQEMMRIGRSWSREPKLAWTRMHL